MEYIMALKQFLTGLILIAAATGCTRKDPVSATSADAGNASAPKVSTTGDILVGEFGSFTGSEATFGISTHEGVMMAIDEKNKAGGVKGRQLKVLNLDDQGKPEEAAAVVTRLITQNNVVAIIGEVASSRSLAAAPIAQQHQIPMISPSSTNPQVTEIGNYIFRVCFIDPFQGTAMAKFANNNLKAKKVAILRDVKSDYSVGLANFFAKTFQELGGQIVDTVDYQSGDMNFMAQLHRIKSKTPDAIFLPGYYTEVGLIAQQAKQAGLKVPLLGGDGWDSSKLYEIAKDAINGHYFSNHYTTESTDPAVQDFIKKYKERYNKVPDGLAALGYDSAKILIEAMERATEIQPAVIRDELAKTKDFKGVTGTISINEERNAVKPAVVVKVDGTTNRFVTKIDP
jgi:branched-chain amino acid transport system substrate-binding protein